MERGAEGILRGTIISFAGFSRVVGTTGEGEAGASGIGAEGGIGMEVSGEGGIGTTGVEIGGGTGIDSACGTNSIFVSGWTACCTSKETPVSPVAGVGTGKVPVFGIPFSSITKIIIPFISFGRKLYCS